MCIYTHVSPRRTPPEKDAHGAAEGIQLALSSWQRTLLHARSPFQPGTHEPKVESALDVFLQHPCTSAHRIMQLLRCPPPWPPNPGLLHQLHGRGAAGSDLMQSHIWIAARPCLRHAHLMNCWKLMAMQAGGRAGRLAGRWARRRAGRQALHGRQVRTSAATQGRRKSTPA